MQYSTPFYILHKELAIEFRQKFAVGSVFLFAATVVFLLFKTFNNIQTRDWVLLIWTIMLFAGLNATLKSFMQEKKETWVYYYTLFDPISLVVAKLIYNTLFLCILFILILVCMGIFSGFPVRDLSLFALSSFLGITGLSSVYTFVSVMAATENGGATLMAILALPLTLPILLLLIKITSVSAGLLADTAVYEDVWLLGGIDLLFLGTILLLFPFVWRS